MTKENALIFEGVVVEMAGIEPASESFFQRPSTSVV
jgi:hypothetical protein